MVPCLSVKDLYALRPGQIAPTVVKNLYVSRQDRWFVVVNTFLGTKRFYCNPQDVVAILWQRDSTHGA